MQASEHRQRIEAQGIMARVAQALRNAGLNQSEAARRATEIHPKAVRATLNKAVTTGNRPRDPEVRDAFAKVLGVDAKWLWDEPPLRRQPSMMAYIREVETPTALPPTPFAIRPDPAGYALPVSHDHWAPIATSGDCLFVTPSYPPALGDRVLADIDGQLRLLRVASVDGAWITLECPVGGKLTFPSSRPMLRVGGIAYR